MILWFISYNTQDISFVLFEKYYTSGFEVYVKSQSFLNDDRSQIL